MPYDQVVVFLETLHPTAAPACRLSVTMATGAPAGSKVRISGVSITPDPGHLSGRVGEVGPSISP